jgi:hypothetical protein
LLNLLDEYILTPCYMRRYEGGKEILYSDKRDMKECMYCIYLKGKKC